MKKNKEMFVDLSYTRTELKEIQERNSCLEQSLVQTTFLQGNVLNDIFKARVKQCMNLLPLLFYHSKSLASKVVVLSLWRNQISKILYLFAKWTGFCNYCEDYLHKKRLGQCPEYLQRYGSKDSYYNS
mmetsp:Transcript_17153/g.15136  ORF Transcript_17153/g.15136 Transcript_17153/m.15136 type:complete len:128 (+) Transcript_17153:1509-1892(+)